MIDMVKNAKDLIAKGKALGDSELVQMGLELLEQYSPTPSSIDGNIPQPQTPQYVCENCGHTMPVDKEGRKRCPECKKHKLKLYKPQPQPKTQTESFITQIRDPSKTKSRVRYNENGEPDGVYTKTEPISNITNTWEDDGVEAKDEANELLKKFTKVSPRTRKPPKKIKVVCEACHKEEEVHPIHAGARGRYLCSRCIVKRR